MFQPKHLWFRKSQSRTTSNCVLPPPPPIALPEFPAGRILLASQRRSVSLRYLFFGPDLRLNGALTKMPISVFDLFTIGIGPSSSHTVGPMRAAKLFVEGLVEDGQLESTTSVCVELFGSLGATGRGHGSDKAVIAGLCGIAPETADPDEIVSLLNNVTETKRLNLNSQHEINFKIEKQLKFLRKVIGIHPNAMTITARDTSEQVLIQKTYYSIGGGFVVNEDAEGKDRIVEDSTVLPHPFTTGVRLLEVNFVLAVELEQPARN